MIILLKNFLTLTVMNLVVVLTLASLLLFGRRTASTSQMVRCRNWIPTSPNSGPSPPAASEDFCIRKTGP